MKIAIYLKSAQDDEFYRDLLRSFAKGIQTDEVILIDDTTIDESADVGVIFGSWKDSTKDHHYFKSKLVEYYKDTKKNFIVIETPILARKIVSDHKWWRVGWNDFMYDSGWFSNGNHNSDRWHKLITELGINVKPWKQNIPGEKILIMLQLPGDASMKGEEIHLWCLKTVHELRKHTNRPIEIRPHPIVRNYDWQLFDIIMQNYPNIRFQDFGEKNLDKSFQNCHAVITYSSGSAIDAAIAGIPVWTLSPGNLAFPIGNYDLKHIESPRVPDRTQWLNNLAWGQWNVSEMEQGLAWQHLRPKALVELPNSIVSEKNPVKIRHPKEKEVATIMKKAKKEKLQRLGHDKELSRMK